MLFPSDWHRAVRQPIPGGRHWPRGEDFQAQDGFGLDEGVLQIIPCQAFYNHDGIIFPDTIWF